MPRKKRGANKKQSFTDDTLPKVKVKRKTKPKPKVSFRKMSNTVLEAANNLGHTTYQWETRHNDTRESRVFCLKCSDWGVYYLDTPYFAEGKNLHGPIFDGECRDANDNSLRLFDTETLLSNDDPDGDAAEYIEPAA